MLIAAADAGYLAQNWGWVVLSVALVAGYAWLYDGASKETDMDLREEIARLLFATRNAENEISYMDDSGFSGLKTAFDDLLPYDQDSYREAADAILSLPRIKEALEFKELVDGMQGKDVTTSVLAAQSRANR